MDKMIIENYMNEVWNKRNLEIVNELFTDTTVVHSPLGMYKSKKEMSEAINRWITAIPDIKVKLLNTVEDDGLVVSHWKAEGTHKEDLIGIKAKGNHVEYQGVSMFRLQNGKVVEYWSFLDGWTLQQQMKKD